MATQRPTCTLREALENPCEPGWRLRDNEGRYDVRINGTRVGADVTVYDTQAAEGYERVYSTRYITYASDEPAAILRHLTARFGLAPATVMLG